MPTLTEQEKRTIRLGLVVLGAGLLLAGGLWCVRRLQERGREYRSLLLEAQDVRDEMDRYQDKAAVAQKLMDGFHLDPMTLSRASLVAQASAAIQKASNESGVGLGSIRETPAHPGSREIASIECEGNGQVTAVMAFLYNLERAGAPLIVDSVRITAGQPGAIKVNLSIVVLDFEQWKAEEPPHA